MKSRAFAVLALSLGASLLYACHTKSSAAGTPAGIYCNAKVAGESICYGYSNLDASPYCCPGGQSCYENGCM